MPNTKKSLVFQPPWSTWLQVNQLWAMFTNSPTCATLASDLAMTIMGVGLVWGEGFVRLGYITPEVPTRLAGSDARTFHFLRARLIRATF